MDYNVKGQVFIAVVVQELIKSAELHEAYNKTWSSTKFVTGNDLGPRTIQNRVT